jgi:hypothetical protein
MFNCIFGADILIQVNLIFRPIVCQNAIPFRFGTTTVVLLFTYSMEQPGVAANNNGNSFLPTLHLFNCLVAMNCTLTKIEHKYANISASCINMHCAQAIFCTPK